METLNKLMCVFFGEKVGQDTYGNIYYRSAKFARIFRSEKRWVRYNGMPEFTKIPTKLYAWLHHQTDEVDFGSNKYHWQEDRKINLTGTKKAYNPKISKKHNNFGIHIWSPDNTSN